MRKRQFFNTLKHFHLQPRVEDGRISFSSSSALIDARKTLDENPELEAEMILHIAAHDPDLLEAIQERASIRWVEGLSDSLYDAVMCNIQPTQETIERDADGKIRQKPPTNWVSELSKYE